MNIATLETIPIGTQITIRARIRISRVKKTNIFIVLRQQLDTIQCIYSKTNNMDNFFDTLSNIPKESIVDLTGTIVAANVRQCTVKTIELIINDIFVVSLSEPVLPIQIDEHIYLPEKNAKLFDMESKLVTRLNNRVLDLRRSDNQLIFRIQADITKIIRNFLDNNNFMEIHTPKMISTASESGSNVFEIKYFNKEAYLAQSPQLYKQMAICADFPRVYEIGPVFRAEKSFTHRHLTEFTGVDLEMVFYKDYHEILDFFDQLFVDLFVCLDKKWHEQVVAFNKDFNVAAFEFVSPSIRISHQEAVIMLRENGIDMAEYDDFNTEREKALGKIIKDKFHTDFFMVDQFPLAVRPFYTMPNTANPLYSNSYDFFIRGEEILSGAQRINDYTMLVDSAKHHGIDIDKIHDYLESFKYGTPLHGGGGIGLERVVMLYLGINNIRNVSMFPRDPKRLTP